MSTATLNIAVEFQTVTCCRADCGVRWTYPAARDVARSILRALERRALTEGDDHAEH